MLNIKLKDLVLPFWVMTDNENVGVRISDIVNQIVNCEDCNDPICCSATTRNIVRDKTLTTLLERIEELEKKVEELTPLIK